MLAKLLTKIIMFLNSCPLHVFFRNYHRGAQLAVLGFMTDFISLKIRIKGVDKLLCRVLLLFLYLALGKLCYGTIDLAIPTLLI